MPVGIQMGLTLVAVLAIAGIWAWLAARHKIRRIEARFPPRAEFITVDGVKLHLRQTGPKDRPAILVLHGAASNLEEPFLALAEQFADERMLWLDRPGLGWSERPRGAWTPAREARLIARLIEQVGAGPVTVIGHSWGGAIAMRLAIDHPEAVEGVVLVAPALSAWIGEAAWFNAASFWPGLGPLISFVVVPLVGEAQARSGAIAAFHPEPVPQDYVERSALPLLLRPSVWRANARDMVQVNHHLEIQETRYADIPHPTEIINARADTVLWAHRHGGMVAERMASARLRWVSGAGHNLHHHHPDVVLDAVRSVRARARSKTGNTVLTGPAA